MEAFKERMIAEYVELDERTNKGTDIHIYTGKS